LRWTVPVVAAVTIAGGGAAIGTFAASAEPSLPPRTAAQLLVDLQTARLEGLSGTVVQRADLGLPPLAGLVGDRMGGIGALAAGTNTVRVWYAGPDQTRLAVVGTLGETDMIRDGRDVWLWSSQSNEASHYRLPADEAPADEAKRRPAHSGLPATPQEAADQALAAIDPSTEVTVGRSATIAGRDAYELVLRPRDAASLVKQVRIAIDAKQHVPLRFEVFAPGGGEPAFEVAFTQVDFDRPDPEQFRFNPPPGAKVTEKSGKPHPEMAEKAAQARKEAQAGKEAAGARTVGTGWGTVWTAELPKEADKAGRSGKPDEDVAGQLDGLRQLLPEVSGEWGKGRLLAGKLFSVLVTEDGRVFAGLVTPERLYEVAAAGR
jgi:outer membrane lipoprotein-sorting protein